MFTLGGDSVKRIAEQASVVVGKAMLVYRGITTTRRIVPVIIVGFAIVVRVTLFLNIKLARILVCFVSKTISVDIWYKLDTSFGTEKVVVDEGPEL